ncbi:MAG: hypothetical protein RR558_11355, partial [Coprobacillus sp.]
MDYFDKIKDRLSSKLKDKELRFKIWENLKNIAEGLNLLHENGFLHRNINTKSIIVNINDEI